MKTIPVNLMAAALLLWGWQTGSWGFAIILSILAEGSRVIRTRFEISIEHFKWIADLCAVMMISTTIYLFFNQASDQFVYILLRYLPLIVAPMFIAQIYSTSDKIDIRTISMISRRSRQNAKPMYVNLSYPFLALVVISASFSPEKNLLFYPVFLLIAVYGFYSIRNRRYSLIIWGGYFLLLSSLGFAAHVGLNRLQLLLEREGVEWFSNMNLGESDPFRSVTAIGKVGELKASNRIAFRIRPENPLQLPILLREAVYDRLYKNEWFALHPEFTRVRYLGKDVWTFDFHLHSPQRITIISSFQNGKGLLKLPAGVVRIRNLPAEEMTRNRFGAVRVEGTPGYAEYLVEYGGTGISDPPPSERDLQIPEEQIETKASVLKEISDKLELQKLSPKESVKRIDHFFKTEFTYSLKNTEKTSNPINRFLQTTRSGHCEYFATAGVLLLRQAGIHSRYVVGFSAHEWSDRENLAIVRTRHAHAWTLAWVDGKWIDADFTPSIWRDAETQSVSQWRSLTDLWDYAVFQFQQWKWHKTDRSVYAFWLILPLVLILGRRFLILRKTRKVKALENADAAVLKNRIVSPFDAVAEFLQHQGYIRLPGESLKTWISRICREGFAEKTAGELNVLVNIHYGLRFDPNGIKPEEYQRLEESARYYSEP